MTKKKTICVYCSSSNYLPETFYTFGQNLGEAIGKNNYNMVYGGTVVGMMGVIAQSAIQNGSEVTGVIPEVIAAHGIENHKLAKIILTKDMRERKAVMEKLSDVFVAAPGGFGTFEEIFEILVGKQLGYHDKPIIFLNFDGYYNNLFKMFDTIYQNNFAQENVKSLYYISESIEDLFVYIKNYAPKEFVFKY